MVFPMNYKGKVKLAALLDVKEEITVEDHASGFSYTMAFYDDDAAASGRPPHEDAEEPGRE